MTFELLHRPSAAAVRLLLQPGDAIRAETGSMIAMSPEIDVEARTGGLGKIVSRLLAGEKVFQTRFIARNVPGQLLLAPATHGDVQAVMLENDAYLVSSGAFLAGSDQLELNTRTKLKNFLIGEDLFMLRVSGSGLMFINAFGAIHAQELLPGEQLSVDTGHLVAWSDTMDVRVRKAGRSYLGAALSGEGIVATLTGPGVIYIQTRSPQAFGAYMASHLPAAK